MREVCMCIWRHIMCDRCLDALQTGASQFEASANKLKRKYWWQNIKVSLIILIIFVCWNQWHTTTLVCTIHTIMSNLMANLLQGNEGKQLAQSCYAVLSGMAARDGSWTRHVYDVLVLSWSLGERANCYTTVPQLTVQCEVSAKLFIYFLYMCAQWLCLSWFAFYSLNYLKGVRVVVETSKYCGNISLLKASLYAMLACYICDGALLPSSGRSSSPSLCF